MRYSAASINQEEIQVSFFLFLRNQNKTNVRAPKETVLSWMQNVMANTTQNVSIERERRDKSPYYTRHLFVFVFF